GCGDLRGDGRWPAVRLPRHADRAAGGCGDQRAAALRRRALPPERPVHGRAAHARDRAGAVRGRTRHDRRGHAAAAAAQGSRSVSVPPNAGGTPQLPLALRYPPEQRLESYIGAPEGALGQLRGLALNPGVDWIYLEGPAGSGKTHLGLGVCAEADGAGRRAAYLPLRAARGRLREALEAQEADVVALDGLEAIAGDRDDEVALFDFHNRMRAAGASVLYLATAAPQALPLVLPDLRSRLGQCTRIALHPLDDEGRRAVLRDRARRRGLVLEEAAIDWLLTRTGRDMGHLLGLLERIDRASLAAQRRVTVPFLRGLLDAG